MRNIIYKLYLYSTFYLKRDISRWSSNFTQKVCDDDDDDGKGYWNIFASCLIISLIKSQTIVFCFPYFPFLHYYIPHDMRSYACFHFPTFKHDASGYLMDLTLTTFLLIYIRIASLNKINSIILISFIPFVQLQLLMCGQNAMFLIHFHFHNFMIGVIYILEDICKMPLCYGKVVHD